MRVDLSKADMAIPLLLFVAIAMITFSCSCSFFGDADAATPGYKLFKGNTRGFRLTFEYPGEWQRKSVERYDDSIQVAFNMTRVSSMSVGSDLVSSPKGYASAKELVGHFLDLASRAPESQILTQSQSRLAHVDAAELAYSYRLKFTDAHSGSAIDRVVVERILAADYENRVYTVMLLASVEEYEGIRGGFEHLIASFRFLE